LLGFLVWNFPRGLIFLGDGGAYLVGFWVAELSVLLTTRNPEVSKWFPLLLCIYPIFETLFSIYRRLIVKKSNPSKPDASHLHQLVYKRVVRCSITPDNPSLHFQRNSVTSQYLWVLTTLSFIPAVLFWRYPLVLILFTILFSLTYIHIYICIIRFKTPKWIFTSNRG
jgi:UDP-N-acetylmuramyl pentapeptide phosphotransferase/UDP-N-acetylglucosamine-1-phosphate transferase